MHQRALSMHHRQSSLLAPSQQYPARSHRYVRRKLDRDLKAESHPEDKAPMVGDPVVQEQLLQMVRIGMTKQTLKDNVRKFAQEEAEKRKESNEKAKEEVERQERLLKETSARRFEKAQADVNRLADEAEEQLRANRIQIEQDKAEFEDWEEKMTRERNQGYFFQGLYETDKQKAKRKQKQMKGRMAPETKQLQTLIQQSEALSSVQSLVPQRKSNVRASIFVFLALNLSFLAIADILSNSPTYMLDALHAALAVTLLTSVWFEKQLLSPSNKEERKN